MKSNNKTLVEIFLWCLLGHIIIMPFFGFVIPNRITKKPYYQRVYLYQESKSEVVNSPGIRTNPQLPTVKTSGEQKIGIPITEQGYRRNMVEVGLPKTPLLTVENQHNIQWEFPIPEIHTFTTEKNPQVSSINNLFTESGGKIDSGGFEITGPGGNRLILSKVLPEYPLWAEKENIEANVKVKIWVDKDGTVTSASTVETSGYRKLDLLAEETLKKWKFSAINQDINVWAIVALKFRLQ